MAGAAWRHPHLLVLVVAVRVVADANEDHVRADNRHEDERNLLPLVGLGCDTKGGRVAKGGPSPKGKRQTDRGRPPGGGASAIGATMLISSSAPIACSIEWPDMWRTPFGANWVRSLMRACMTACWRLRVSAATARRLDGACTSPTPRQFGGGPGAAMPGKKSWPRMACGPRVKKAHCTTGWTAAAVQRPRSQ